MSLKGCKIEYLLTIITDDIFQVANLNDKYETPKDLVNFHKPLRSYHTRNSQKVGLKNSLGVHVATLESNPLDVVYSDPKDSKLYQIPGAGGAEASKPIASQDLAEINQPYKVYMSPIREDQYCRPYVTMRPFMQQQTSGTVKTALQALSIFMENLINGMQSCIAHEAHHCPFLRKISRNLLIFNHDTFDTFFSVHST